jgi:inorganic pyrophosphatase
MGPRNLTRLPAFDKESGLLNIVVETPRDGRTKYKYNEKYDLFEFDKTMPYGFSFPFEFGFVPSTLGGDGDPLDALVLCDEATFSGCLILGQILGVLQAEQSDGKKTNRNDRVVAVPVNVKDRKTATPSKTLDEALIADMTKFFVAYNEAQGKKFKSLGFGSRQRAIELIDEAGKRAQKKRK